MDPRRETDGEAGVDDDADDEDDDDDADCPATSNAAMAAGIIARTVDTLSCLSVVSAVMMSARTEWSRPVGARVAPRD